MQRKVALLLMSLSFLPQVFGKSNPKEFCSVLVKQCLQVRGDEIICGNLAVGGNAIIAGSLSVTGPITAADGLTVGGLPITTFISGLVNSLVPFASGPIASATLPLLPLGIVMGFGANAPLAGVPAGGPTITTQTEFAFTAPSAGTIHDLRVRADSNFILTSVAPFTLTYTIYHSTCVAGTAQPYVATPVATTVTIPATTVPLLGNVAVSACGASAATFDVAAGDQLVLQVNSNIALSSLTISLLGLSAGLYFTPA